MMDVAFIIGFAGNRQGTIWPECDGENAEETATASSPESSCERDACIWLGWATVDSVAYSAMVVR